MATSNHYDASEDFTVCPICFEKFQTPRSLPCTHTFCHRCLSAHIKSSCSDCDPALGFPCPVCRAFVPAPGVLRQYPIEDWASRFPENLFLSSCVRTQTSLTNITCGPCRIDCEIDIKAESWCMECEDSLCEKCIQNHRKYKALQSHRILSISNYGLDFTKPLKDLETEILKCCEKHEKRNIEFVCETDQTGCCSICVVNEHKHCGKVSTLLNAGDMFADEKKVKIVQEIKDLLSNIETITQKEKQNISDVDNKKDAYTEMIKKMIEEMVNRLKTQEKTYLDQLAEISKDARQKLERSLRSLEQRKLYLAHWLEIVSTDSPNKETEHILKYLKANKVLEAVKGLPLIQLTFDLSAEISNGIEKLDSLGSLCSAKITENTVNLSVIQNDKMVLKTEVSQSSLSHADESHEKSCKLDSSFAQMKEPLNLYSPSFNKIPTCDHESDSYKKGSSSTQSLNSVSVSYIWGSSSTDEKKPLNWNQSSNHMKKTHKKGSSSTLKKDCSELRSSSIDKVKPNDWSLTCENGSSSHHENETYGTVAVSVFQTKSLGSSLGCGPSSDHEDKSKNIYFTSTLDNDFYKCEASSTDKKKFIHCEKSLTSDHENEIYAKELFSTQSPEKSYKWGSSSTEKKLPNLDQFYNSKKKPNKKGQTSTLTKNSNGWGSSFIN